MTDWLSHTLDFGKYDKPLVVRELLRRLVTFETFDLSDEGA